MPEPSSIQMSQGFDILRPKNKKAYPVLLPEWDNLKKKIKRIKDRAGKLNLFTIIGSLLLGAGFSTTINAFFHSCSDSTYTTNIPKLLLGIPLIIIGISFLFIIHLKEKHLGEEALDIIDQMELIEERYS